MMEFQLLGDFQVWHDGGQLDLGGRKQKCVLAVLLRHPRQVVSTKRIVACDTELGTVQRLTGDIPGATDALTQALDTYREFGDSGNTAWALNHYAATTAASGDPTRALAHYREALAMNRKLNKPDDEAIALEGIGTCLQATGDTPSSVTYVTQALKIYQRLGMQSDTSRIQTYLDGLINQYE